MAGRMEKYARAGYLTAAIDCRYHGDRAVPEAAVGSGSAPPDPRSAYQDSLVRCVSSGSRHHPKSRCVSTLPCAAYALHQSRY